MHRQGEIKMGNFGLKITASTSTINPVFINMFNAIADGNSDEAPINMMCIDAMMLDETSVEPLLTENSDIQNMAIFLLLSHTNMAVKWGDKFYFGDVDLMDMHSNYLDDAGTIVLQYQLEDEEEEMKHDFREFDRNALGRMVSTAEEFKGLPITTREELIAQFPNIDDQIARLKARLEEVGGPAMVPAWFGFDEGPCWHGFHSGSTWNGWAMPGFTKETCDQIIAWFNENKGEDNEPDSIYDVEKDAYLMGFDVMNDPDNIEDYYYTKSDQTGLYGLGAGSYTWSIIEDMEEVNERKVN
jgi:hypothetical protein